MHTNNDSDGSHPRTHPGCQCISTVTQPHKYCVEKLLVYSVLFQIHVFSPQKNSQRHAAALGGIFIHYIGKNRRCAVFSAPHTLSRCYIIAFTPKIQHETAQSFFLTVKNTDSWRFRLSLDIYYLSCWVSTQCHLMDRIINLIKKTFLESVLVNSTVKNNIFLHISCSI